MSEVIQEKTLKRKDFVSDQEVHVGAQDAAITQYLRKCRKSFLI